MLSKKTLFISIIVFISLFAFEVSATFNFLGTVRSNNGTVIPGALVNITTAPFYFPGSPVAGRVQQNFSAVTNSTGNFVINVTNTSDEGFTGNYRIRIYLNKSDGNVSHMGPLYPELPSFALQNELSGGNFYIGPAATIVLEAYNSSALINPADNASYANYRGNVSFSGMIVDLSLGMPVDMFTEFTAGANGAGNVTSHRFIVPVGRNYSIVMYRPFNITAAGGIGSEPATPPLAVRIQVLNATNAYNLDSPSENFTNTSGNLFINITRNLTLAKVYIQGFVNVTGNTTAVNFTRILAYPMVNNFVAIDAPIFLLPAEQQMVTATGRYNITLIGGSAAVTYLLIAFGVHQNGTAADFGGFVNISITNTDRNGFNFTLEQLAGGYSSSNNNLNISQSVFNISGSSLGGNSNVQGAYLEVNTSYNTNAGQTFIRWIVRPNSSGMVSLPIIRRYDGNITVTVYSQMFAPKKIKVNITNSTYIPIKLKSFNVEKCGFGDNNGSSGLNFTGNMIIKVYANNVTCNVFTPQPSCLLTGGSDTHSSSFSPMKFMLGGGKINMRIDQDKTGMSVMFLGVDMLGSGPPDVSFNDQAESNTSSNDKRTQNWKFGSGAPEIYDQVIYSIHYEDNEINDSLKMNITMATLYDNDWNPLWNGSSNTLGQNIPGDFAGFNNSWFNQSNPMHCDDNISKVITVNSTYQGCYLNATNNTIWISVPHFSGQTAGLTTSGTKASGGGSSPGSSGGSSVVDSSGKAKTTTEIEEQIKESNSIINEIKQSAERIEVILQDSKIKSAIEAAIGTVSDTELAKTSETVAKSISVSRSIESKISTVLTTNIKYSGKEVVNKFVVYDIIPKSFASTTDDITISTPANAKYTILEKDPKVLIVFENIAEGDNIVTYVVDKHLSANVINDFDSPILFAKEVLTKEEAAKKAEESIKKITTAAITPPTKKPYVWVIYLLILVSLAVVIYFVAKKKDLF